MLFCHLGPSRLPLITLPFSIGKRWIGKKKKKKKPHDIRKQVFCVGETYGNFASLNTAETAGKHPQPKLHVSVPKGAEELNIYGSAKKT